MREQNRRLWIERENEVLVALAARGGRDGEGDGATDGFPPDLAVGDGWPGDPRLLGVMARALRSAVESGRLPTGETVGEREARLDATASTLRERALAARHAVRRVDARPALRVSEGAGAVSRVLETAAAARCAPWLDLGVAAGVGRDLWDEACESWVELPDDLPRGRYVALTVSGESMTPLMHPGDVVLVRLGPEVARDAVVVARRPEHGYVVKKVARFDRRRIELESLNPAFPPMSIPRDDQLVVGTVVLRWCAHQGAQPGAVAAR